MIVSYFCEAPEAAEATCNVLRHKPSNRAVSVTRPPGQSVGRAGNQALARLERCGSSFHGPDR